MVRFLPLLIVVGLLIYCLIDCVQTGPGEVRNLPKPIWLLIIVFLPVIGPIAWLIAGRTWGAQGSALPWRSSPPADFPERERLSERDTSASDIDEQLRRDQERVDREHEEALRRWEENRRKGKEKPDEEKPAS